MSLNMRFQVNPKNFINLINYNIYHLFSNLMLFYILILVLLILIHKEMLILSCNQLSFTLNWVQIT